MLSISAQSRNSVATVTLEDGRILGYAEYGDPKGFPVFYFHGGQESRLSSGFMDASAFKLNIRIIAPDRPGIGLSTFHPERTFLSWAEDVRSLADQLEIKKFSVFGLSGGSPHTLACAYAIPEYLEKVSIISGAAPYGYKGHLKGAWFPIKLIHWFAAADKEKNLRKFMEREALVLNEKPEKRIKQLQKFLPGPDKKALKQTPEWAHEFVRGSQESFRQGTDAAVQEWRLYVRDWGFNLKDIKIPVQLWYGDRDKMTPRYRGIYLKKQIANAKLRILENEGHFSLIRNHIEDILSDLLPERQITS